MPRQARSAPGGLIYHVLNRSNVGVKLFRDEEDYAAWEQVLAETAARVPGVRVLAYCALPDHWQLLLWPRREGELSRFMALLTVTHAQRWHASHRSAGSGHVYQGRFKSFPVQPNDSLLSLCRYVETGGVRGKMVKRPQDWRWSSLWRRRHGSAEEKALLSPCPVKLPSDWLQRLSRPWEGKEEEMIGTCITRSRPYGLSDWVTKTADKLGLQWTLRPRGRPRKVPVEANEGGAGSTTKRAGAGGAKRGGGTRKRA